MIPKISPKQSGETVRGLYVDFALRLLPGEVVSGATVTCTVAGVNATAAIIPVNSVEYIGTTVTWGATGGTDGTTILFTVVATGDKGSIREAELEMDVIDIP